MFTLMKLNQKDLLTRMYQYEHMYMNKVDFVRKHQDCAPHQTVVAFVIIVFFFIRLIL